MHQSFNKYFLEAKIDGEWTVIREFPNYHLARRHAEEQHHVQWRIFDRTAQEIVETETDHQWRQLIIKKSGPTNHRYNGGNNWPRTQPVNHTPYIYGQTIYQSIGTVVHNWIFEDTEQNIEAVDWIKNGF